MGVYQINNSPTIPGGGGQPIIPVSNYQQPTELVVLKEVQPITTPSGNDSNWQKISNYLRPLDVTNKVIIGNSSGFVGSEILRVVGGVYANSYTTNELVYFRDTSVYIRRDESDNLIFRDGSNLETTLSSLISSTVTPTQINNWNTAYGWGNHASAGYLTVEVDPVFIAHPAYGISGTNITNWGTAYTNTHTHTNKALLDSLISSGAGTQFLADDGTYYTISNTVAGSDTEVQFNNGGVFGSNSNITINDSTNTLTSYDINVTNTLYLNNSAYILDNSGDLTFYDTSYGAPITLSTLAAGATNPWTISGSNIYFGTGTDMVGINVDPTQAELEVSGHIVADNFDSNFFRYENSNVLLGPNAGDNETGSNYLYIANSATANPIIKGNFLSSSLWFNADVLIQSGKDLMFSTPSVKIYEGNDGELIFQDTIANNGSPVNLNNLIDGSINALIADFDDLAAVQAISAGDVLIWNNASILTIAGAGTNFLADDGNYYAAGGGVTPTDYTFKFDLGSSYYRPYTDKTEAGGVASSGKFYGGTSDPSATNRLNYDGYLHATNLYAKSNLELGVSATTPGTLTIYGSTSGSATIMTASVAGNPVLLLPTTTGTLALTSDIVTPTDDILDWSTDKYTPYAAQQAFLSFDTSSTNPTLTTRLNVNGYFYATSLTGRANSDNGVNGWSTSGYGVQGFSTNSTGVYGQSSTGNAAGFSQNASGSTSSHVLVLSKLGGGTSNLTGDIISITDNPTTSGTISGKVLSATIGSTERISLNPRVTNSGTNSAYLLDTDTALTGTTRILNLSVAGSNKSYLDCNGLWQASNFQAGLGSTTTTISDNNINMTYSGTGRLYFQPGVADGASAVAYMFDTHNNLSVGGAKLLSIKNQGTELVYINRLGEYIGQSISITASSPYSGGTGVIQGYYNGSSAYYGVIGVCSNNGYGVKATTVGLGGGLIVTSSNSISGTNSSSLISVLREQSGTGANTGDIINIVDNPTVSGTVSGSILKALIGATTRIDMNPRVADGASAIAYKLDTHNTLSNATAQLLELDNNGVAKHLFYANGNYGLSGNLTSYGKISLGSTAGVSTATLHQDVGTGLATYHKFTAGTTTGTTSNDGFDIGIDSTGKAWISQLENLALGFKTNNTERLTIASTGSVTATGSIYQAGTFAGIYVNDGVTAQNIATGTTYTKMTHFATNEESSNCTADQANDKITITKTGRYYVNWSLSFTTDTNNITLRATVFLNGTEQNSPHAARKIGTGADVGSMSGGGIINVTTAPWDLDLRCRHDGVGTVAVTPLYSNLTVNYVGE
jgi:hypothetical protein